jgi:hypothetical protein
MAGGGWLFGVMAMAISPHENEEGENMAPSAASYQLIGSLEVISAISM